LVARRPGNRVSFPPDGSQGWLRAPYGPHGYSSTATTAKAIPCKPAFIVSFPSLLARASRRCTDLPPQPRQASPEGRLSFRRRVCAATLKPAVLAIGQGQRAGLLARPATWAKWLSPKYFTIAVCRGICLFFFFFFQRKRRWRQPARGAKALPGETWAGPREAGHPSFVFPQAVRKRRGWRRGPPAGGPTAWFANQPPSSHRPYC